MGRPYIERCPFIDYVSNGEADRSFPALCERLRDGTTVVPAGFYRREGFAVREAARVAGTSPQSLDELPVPDFSDYFRVRAATLTNEPGPAWLPIEASRGCWWGEIAHCTFCGLNGETMAFRKKSAQRVLDETDELTARHGPLPLQVDDTILAMEYRCQPIESSLRARCAERAAYQIRSTPAIGPDAGSGRTAAPGGGDICPR